MTRNQAVKNSMLSVGEISLKNKLNCDHRICHFGQKSTFHRLISPFPWKRLEKTYSSGLTSEWQLSYSWPNWFSKHPDVTSLSPFYLSVSPVLWHKWQWVFTPCCTLSHARHAWRLIVWCAASFWWQWTMAEGTVTDLKYKVPNPTHKGIENWKMDAIKINKASTGVSSSPGPQPMFLTNPSWP